MSGVSFWEWSFMGDIYGNILAALVAFLIFWLGYRTQKQKERTDEKERLRERYNAFNEALARINTNIAPTLDNLKNISESLGSDAVGDFINETPRLNTNNISWISKEDLFKLYVLNVKNKNLRTLFWEVLEHIDTVHNFKEQYKTLIDGYSFELKKFSKEWSLKMRELERYIIDLNNDYNAMAFGDGALPYDFLDGALKLHQDYEDLKVTTSNKMLLSSEKYLLPMVEHCNASRTDKHVIHVKTLALEANLAYLNLKKIRGNYKIVFDRVITRLENVQTGIFVFIDAFPINKDD